MELDLECTGDRLAPPNPGEFGADNTLTCMCRWSASSSLCMEAVVGDRAEVVMWPVWKRILSSKMRLLLSSTSSKLSRELTVFSDITDRKSASLRT